jgi:squalene-hopene/tetraprenyl-beta-curcumene cyclase
MTGEFRQRLREVRASVERALLLELNTRGHWVGELSSSALSTATAVIALAVMNREQNEKWISAGLSWLRDNVNPDGGWGDTVRSRSNLSTTALVWGAFGMQSGHPDFASVEARAAAFLSKEAGGLDSLVSAIEARYGKDRTFSVPITMTLALTGRLGVDGWRRVRPLPFELAVLPRAFFGVLQLPVVSYALPALIAIGQVIHHKSGRFNPLRNWARSRTLEVLNTLQPSNGGFLEATPLTSFVTMSLAAMGLQQHPVAQKGMSFLKESMRGDGSWPIDSNLSTWLTTLSVKAVDGGSNPLSSEQRFRLKSWLLGQQYTKEHPYTGAPPGGWAWTDLPGGVPDADDTAGVLIALAQLQENGVADAATLEAVEMGVGWLLDLQNRDGGIPTFCRGWGALPFDRSSPELTAHALRAWGVWDFQLSAQLRGRVLAAEARALTYLAKLQRQDGAWIPLWFGNQFAALEENPVYGTAQVVIGLRPRIASPKVVELIDKGRRYLASVQNGDGGWGGGAGVSSSIEESALAIDALLDSPGYRPNVELGLQWLATQLERSSLSAASPIGLYFARLWYYEKLYPLIFSLGALNRLESEQGRSDGKLL